VPYFNNYYLFNALGKWRFNRITSALGGWSHFIQPAYTNNRNFVPGEGENPVGGLWPAENRGQFFPLDSPSLL
jgi:hypothetical protein